MKKFKENLRCAILALIIVIPMFISLYGLLINNMNVAFRALLSMSLWAPFVLWIDNMIDDKRRKHN